MRFIGQSIALEATPASFSSDSGSSDTKMPEVASPPTAADINKAAEDASKKEDKEKEMDAPPADFSSAGSPKKENDSDDTEEPASFDNAGDGDSSNNDDTSSDEESSEEYTSEPNDPNKEFEDDSKPQLWNSFKKLHDVVSDNLRLLSEFKPSGSDSNTILVIDNLTNNLGQVKTAAYNIMTTDFQSKDYVDLQKKFITLNHIYDICIKELEAYYDIKEDEFKSKDKKHMKDKIKDKTLSESEEKKEKLIKKLQTSH